jgi:hypothetical protein
MAIGVMDFITMMWLGLGMMVAESFSKPNAKLRKPVRELRNYVSKLTEW